MIQKENIKSSIENIGKSGMIKSLFGELNLPLTAFYVILAILQYLFCTLVVRPLIGNVWGHMAFVILFTPLTIYFLWEKRVGIWLEAIGHKIETLIKCQTGFWFAARIIIEIALISLILYLLRTKFTWVASIEWSWLKKALLWIFLIDALVAFLAIYGTKKMQEGIRNNVSAKFRQFEGMIRRDSINEIFYLTSIASIIMKSILTILVFSGVTGTIGIAGGTLLVILPYFLFSVLYTALFITGSFGATFRYWQWLLTEPPKMVVRFIFKIRRDKIRCRHCSRVISLLGNYECPKCHFKFKGHYFKWCPSCYSRFTFIDCDCGLSRKRPFIH